MYVLQGWSLTTLFLGFLSALGCFALLEAVRSKVVLADDSLRVITLWRRRCFERAEIRTVTWERGAGVSLKLANGKWFTLPEFGLNAQGVVNTVRSWLKTTEGGVDG